jgi:formylglycine-generating enzyme required for sulfatase activity
LDKDDNLPVVNVSWDDCQEYIRLLNEKTGRNFALPTEHQWLVCATIDGTMYSGSNDIDEVGWHDENTETVMPVGLKKPNKLGLYDMSGNVWEWCWDKYNNIDSSRVFRGGSYFSVARHCRSSYRARYSPVSRYSHLGFRLVENLK